jgi:hypothetical protein
MQRRTLLASLGSAAAGTTAGAVLLNGSTGKAKAAVDANSFSIGDDAVTTGDGNISNVKASVSGNWSYELPGGSPSQWLVTLRVSDGNTWGKIAETSGSVEYAQYSGTFEVTGSLTDTSLFDVSEFAAPEPGKQKTMTIPFELWFRVVESDDTVLASTALQDKGSVTVAQSEINASLYGMVDGSGSVSIEK